MIFKETYLSGSYTIDLDKNGDNRGFFARYWCHEEFEEMGLDSTILQINNSFSAQKGTLRGLHFQRPPKAETKVVRCIKGAIWDVIVDIRKDSKTYGEWFGEEITAENRTMMYVPKGFAHGFISLTNNSEIIYMLSESYSPKHEDTLRWNDSFHNIKWLIEPKVISKKDSEADDWDDNKAILLEER